MKKIYFLLIALTITSVGFGQIAAWEMNGNAGTETTVSATTLNLNLNTSTLSRGGGLSSSALGNSFASTNYTQGGNQANAISANKYIQFQVSASTGYQVSLSTLDAVFRRSSTGPNMFIWRYSTDGTTFTNIGTVISYSGTTSNGDAQAQINLSAITALQNIASGATITLRLYGWGASATTGTFAIGRLTGNDLAVGGTVVSTCPTYTLPFTENFEGGVVPPTCWTTFRGSNNAGTGEDWKISASGEGYPAIGFAARVNPENVTAVSEDWLVTPAINLGATSNNQLKFYAKDFFNTDQGSTYSVRVSTTTPSIGSFTNILQTYTEAELGNSYNQKTFNLSSFGSATIYIAFVMTQPIGGGDVFFLDNVTVTGDCSFPSTQASGFNATAINSVNGTATLNWTGGNGGNRLVVVRAGSPVNADPTSGMTYAASSAFGSVNQIGTGNYVVYNGTGTSAPITNLTAGTTYYVAIYEYNTVSTCYNLTEHTGNFFVPCASVYPLTEGFEGGTLPSCWAVFENGPTGFNQWTVNGNNPNSGGFSAYVDYDSSGTATPGVSRDWLVTPPINLTTVPNAQLSFYSLTDANSVGNFVSNYSIKISTASQTNPADFNNLVTYTEADLAGSAYTQKTGLDLSAYFGQTIYIAFVMDSEFPDGGENWYIDDVSVNAPPTSAVSDIVEAGFDEPDNINYLAYAAISNLTTSNSIKVGEFTIRDGGSTAPDTDGLATTLTGLSVTVQNFGAIAALALFDGGTKVGEVTTVTATTSFTGLNLVAADNGTKNFSVYATFKTLVTDNQQIQFTIASATASPGSTFAATNAGGAQTSIVADDNKIEVTATALRFNQQPPTNTDVNAVMTPSPTVRAVDSNLNLDLDYVTSFTLSTTGTFAGTATTSATPLAGVATFNNLRFSAAGTGFTMTTVSPLTNGTSTAFNILALPTSGWQIGAANQAYTIDFDNTVANVNSGAYTGAGFTTSNPTPLSSGRLDSGAWAATGWSDPNLVFGGTNTTGDYARGNSTGGETTAGFFSFNVGSGNRTFGIQPTSEFNPGTVTLKAQNETGQTVTSITFSYIVYIRNDQGRASSFNFSYSIDGSSYANQPTLDITSPLSATGNAWVPTSRTITITGLSVTSGSYVYLRWSSADAAVPGSGSRDEFGLDDISVIFNPLVVDNDSNIVATSYDAPDNINYIANTAANGLTELNAVKIGEFSIQDGGNTLTDADTVATVLTDVSFDVLNAANIAALAIFDSGTNVSEVTNVSGTTAFSGLTLSAADNSTKVFSVYATFKPIVTDNQQVQLTITSATAPLTSSGFADTDAGGATTSIAGDDNRIEVIATTSRFVQQPSDVNLGQTMVPSVTVSTTDINGNRDTDFAGSVAMTTTSTFSGTATTSATATSGLATFGNLKFSTIGTFTLTATSPGFTDSLPRSFVVAPATRSFWYEPFTDNSQYTVTLGGEGSGAAGDYFQITDGSNINKTYTGNIGNFFAAQDIDGGGWAGSASPSQLTWTGINVERYTSLNFSGKFASAGNGEIDASDYAKVEYQLDGGGWINLIAFAGPTGTNNSFMEDTDFNGIGDGIMLTNAFRNFSKSIATTGAILDIRITIALNSNNEDIALEDFKLAGIGTVFPGNGLTGFGGAVGTSTLEVYASSGSVVNFIFNRGGGAENFNDDMIIYIDSKVGGITNTQNLTDTGNGGDELRKGVSGYNGSARTRVDFPPGFSPDYAIAVKNDFANLFEIVENGSHISVQSASLAPTGNNATFYTFNINFANILAEPGLESFKFLATYLNANSAFRSNESIGRNTAVGNPGTNSIEFETYYEVSSALQGGKAPTQAAGVWTADGTWLNGNPPLAKDAITINNNTDQNIDVSANGIVVNAALEILPTYTLKTSAGITGIGSLNVLGKLSITEGGFTNISPTYGAGGTLEYKDVLAVYNRFNEWTLGAAPSNVIIDNAALDMTNLSINPNATENFNVGNNLSILNGGSMTIAPVKSVTVGNTIANNGGTVNLNSNSTRYSSLIAGSTSGSGTFNYNRHVNTGAVAGLGGNDLISAPFSGQPFNEFKDANPNIRSNNDQTLYLFGPFEKTNGTYVTYGANETSPLLAGVGYRAASIGGGTFKFTGAMTTGNLNTPISIAGLQFAIWNLIGNPYPSYIKLTDFLAANNAKFDTNNGGVYGYDGTSGGYKIWNSAYALLNPNAVITPGQGFLVASNTALVDVNFTSAMRSTGTTDDFITGRQAEDEPVAYLQLKANIATKDYTTDFYFTDFASRGLDANFDSGLFGNGASATALYSHLVQDNAGIDMGIQSVAYADLSSDVSIPVGINVPQGQQVTVSMVNAMLPGGIDVYLEDTQTGIFTVLNTNDYVFTPNSNLNSTGRFFLRFTDNTLSGGTSDLDNLQIYALNQTLFVNGLLNAATTVTLFDIQGRKVLSSALESGSTNNTIDVSKMSTGVYVVKLNNETQQKTQRVIIK